MNSSEFDRRFDAGQSVLEALDLNGARRAPVKQKRVNVDFPLWMVEQLDREASRLGVTRQSIIKVWLAERLERGRPDASSPAGSGQSSAQESR
ncbi:CopG family transcriptional regulator [Synechococcus sp. CCAP 1479/9]|uniref:type II toxin-antitoxin system BrnA family antitoxin n=1 Tax=Synechococcus sp. CCAP 1479/9 TaxID=1221593 RepID=UPI00256FD103|nr:CopG family transcriptional regulator [Synechococcus sp. CCAP 1479/9]